MRGRHSFYDDLYQLERLSPGQIRNLLLAARAFGVPCDFANCPLAVWLKGRHCVPVHMGWTKITPKWPHVGPSYHFPHGSTVQQFMTNFDRGEYPELIRPDERNDHG